MSLLIQNYNNLIKTIPFLGFQRKDQLKFWNLIFRKKFSFGFPSMVRFPWNISQLIFKNLHFGVCGTAVSWNFRYLGVPSDGEKVVSHDYMYNTPRQFFNVDYSQHPLGKRKLLNTRIEKKKTRLELQQFQNQHVTIKLFFHVCWYAEMLS